MTHHIEEKFPELFSNCFEFSIRNGWVDIVETMCYHINRYAKQHSLKVDVVQVKEKFGTLRFYAHGADDSINLLIDFVESISARTCEVCGAPEVTWQSPKSFMGANTM